MDIYPCTACGALNGGRYGPQGVCWLCWSNEHGGDGSIPEPDLPSRPGDEGGESERYRGRVVNLAELLAHPPRPIPWRVENFVADATLTILTGEATDGKSWVAQAFCTAVARGEPVLGLDVKQGSALYVDGEMGPLMFAERLRTTGITQPDFDYIDAMGLDFSTAGDIAWLCTQIRVFRAKLVVFDSFRRLTPSKHENESDHMAPSIAALAKLARDEGVAIIVIHHKAEGGDKWYRGSTAIRDQCDAMFGLLRDENNPDTALRCLRCGGGKGKMRYAPEPPDLWLEISPEDGGVVEADAPDAPAGPHVRRIVTDSVKQQILEALPVETKKAAADKIDRQDDDKTFRAAWSELQEAGQIARQAGAWRVVVVPQTPSTTTTTTTTNGHGEYDPEAAMSMWSTEHDESSMDE